MIEPWLLKGDQLTLHCHIQPGAKHTRLVGLYDNCLKIQLQSPPVDGKANKALIAFLAKLFRVPKSAIQISRGLGSRRKTIIIAHPGDLPVEIEKLKI